MKHLLNSFMLFLMLFIGHSSYVKGDTTIASGTIDGTSIKWSVTSPDGTQENLKLSVTGSGAIPSYQSDFSPWEKYNHKTTEIYVAPTITEIGDYAFFETAITSFEIPSSCTRIGASAFLRCTNLKEIYIPSNVETIGALAFRGCTSLSLIHYDGRCTSNTIISSNVNDLGVANGKIIEKEGTGASYAFIPEGWEYYTHGEQCNGGAWVAESGTKLFFYAQKPNASVNYASAETLTSDQQDLPQYHPWRANSDKYTSIEINRNISTFGNYELMGYTDSNTGIVKGYSNLQTITVESGNPIYIVGEDGALYNDVKSKLFLYPAQNPATHFDVPVTVGSIRPGTFCDAKNLQSISFLNTLKNVWISQHAFANASSLSYISFASEAAPAQYYLSSFVGLPRDGVVVAPTETDEFKRLTQYITSAVGSNWTFATGSGNVVSYLSSDGTLYVAGNGEYTTSSSNASWYSQRNSIKKIVVKEGITNIGIRAFSGCTNVTEVTLNNTGSIEALAFEDCKSLTRVNIGTGHIVFSTYSSSSPFDGCSKLSVVNVADFASFCKITNFNYLTDSYYGTAEEKTLMVNGVTHDPSSELVIPEGVTSISKDQFGYFKNVTKIRIPSTVMEIRERKCANCKYLTEITIPSTVNSVGQEAFYGCTALKTVTLNNTGTIGVSAFNGCTALKTVTINNTCTIGIRAFSGCTNITEVTLNNTGSIEALAFEYCKSLTRVNIGTGHIVFSTYSSSSPFDGCSKLSVVNVADFASFCKITNFNYLTDSYYGTAEEKTLMVNGVTHDPSSELVIPEGVTSISKDQFGYFKNVTKIRIPSTVMEIRERKCANCKYLTEITIPSTVNSVGQEAFYGCTALKTVTLNNTGTIGVSAFNGCTALKTVTINNTCTIGIRAFSGCTNITEVTLNNTGSIEALAFEYCTSLTRVNIGTGLIEFCINTSSSPFDGCSKLATINVTDLAKYCSIKNLKYLTDSSYGTAANKTLMVNGGTHSSSRNLEIPEGVTEISQYAFRYFSNVTAIKLPESMKTISSSNFYGHTYLETIILPATVTSVGSSAFSGCSNLEYIICQATACPSVTSSIATNPGKITLKVPRGKASLYKAANVWKDFNVEELIYNVENMDLYDYGMLTSNGYLMTRLSYNNYQVWSWTSTNPDVAKMIGTVLYVKDYVYDGTTAKPYKEFSVIADLGDCDTCVWNIRLYPREVVLTDGSVYKNTKSFDANKISYTRYYAPKYANHLQCFYVPFDVEVTDELLEDFTFYELYTINQKDLNENGEIEDDEPLTMFLTKLPVGRVMHANMPYYIKPKAESTLTVTAENATLYAAWNGYVYCSTTKHEYTLTGIYEPKNIKGYYTMSAKGNFSYYTQDTNLGSYRWYMSIKNRRELGADLDNYARPIQIVIDGEDETTGIADLQDKAFASKNDKIYTLDGRQVTDYDNLPSGIYIINGKKVFKK